jgi:hypothetical protein
LQDEIAAGVVASRHSADDTAWEKWQLFCASLGIDEFLEGVTDTVPYCQVFLRRVRDGRLAANKQGAKVRARTAEAYLRAVAQTFTSLGKPDPRLNTHGTIDFRIQRQQRGYKKVDPPPRRLKPLPIDLFILAADAARAVPTPKCQALANMIYIAFFFLMRPGEHCDSGPESHPFRWEDVGLSSGGRNLDVMADSSASLRSADFCTLTFTTQKSGVAGEVVGHGKSGSLLTCPVRALTDQILLLRAAGGHPTMPLASYRPTPTAPFVMLRAADFTSILKQQARLHGYRFGITEADVSVGCFRTSGAMSLFCANVDSSRIRLLGRWNSWAMLRYLHLQARPTMSGFARRMLIGGRFDLLPPAAAPPDIDPEDPDAPPAVVPNPNEPFEQV